MSSGRFFHRILLQIPLLVVVLPCGALSSRRTCTPGSGRLIPSVLKYRWSRMERDHWKVLQSRTKLQQDTNVSPSCFPTQTCRRSHGTIKNVCWRRWGSSGGLRLSIGFWKRSRYPLPASPPSTSPSTHHTQLLRLSPLSTPARGAGYYRKRNATLPRATGATVLHSLGSADRAQTYQS